MSFRRITFVLNGDQAERLGDALLAAGALSVEITDADAGTDAERAAFDEPDQVRSSWRRCRLSALFDAAADVGAVSRRALAAAGLDALPPSEECEVQDRDWVRATRDQFKPIRISQRLWIVPTWEEVPDPGALSLRLDPGLAFGTGSHPTTRLCLQWLEAYLRPGARVLDYGCGSGILAIAAMKLGAAAALGIDIDPQALIAARDNAMQNGVAVRFLQPGDEPAIGYDVVLANILANPLLALAPLLAARTAPGGYVVLSGILQEQAAEVTATYRRWFEVAPAVVDEGWVLLAGHRRGEAPS